MPQEKDLDRSRGRYIGI